MNNINHVPREWEHPPSFVYDRDACTSNVDPVGESLPCMFSPMSHIAIDDHPPPRHDIHHRHYHQGKGKQRQRERQRDYYQQHQRHSPTHAPPPSMMMFLANKATSRNLSSVPNRIWGDGEVGKFRRVSRGHCHRCRRDVIVVHVGSSAQI